MNDIKYGIRTFLKSPGFTAVAVLTLALGVGATTAIFSVVNAVLLKPLPYANAERLVVARLSLPDYRDLQASVSSFDGIAVWASNLYNLRSGTESQQVLGGVVSRELMPLLGVEPLLGRNFTEADERQETVFAQTPFLWMYFMVRSNGSPVAASIRATVSSIDPSLTAANLRPMEEVVADTVADPRFQTLLVSSFAALALALAAIGIYGVIAYSIAQRVHEIGIRMALGAAGSDVLALVLREGLLMAAAGVALGLASSALLTRLMSSLLVGVTPRDPIAFGAAGALFLIVAAIASYVPARRAVRVDPIVALRAE